MSESSAAQPRRWPVLFTPRWLSWHLFAIVAFVGMLWLGDWQFTRAINGNALSWAYTFEWPVFAVFGAVFWVKTVKDELRPPATAEDELLELPDNEAEAGQSAAGGLSLAQQQLARARARPAIKDDEPTETEAAELAEYNAYLAKLGTRAVR